MAYAIKTAVGWSHHEVTRYGVYQFEKVAAKLLGERGNPLLVLDHAKLVASSGWRGALIEGVEYRKRGSKQSIKDAQA